MGTEAVAPRLIGPWAPARDRRHAVWAGVVWFLAAYAALSVAVIAVGLVLTHGPLSVKPWDRHVSEWLFARRTTYMNTVTHWGTFVANTMGIVVVAMLVTGWTAVRRCGRLIALVPVGLVLELLVFLTANYTVRRPRPGVPHLGSTPTTYSYPSGHVAATLVLYGAIALLVSIHTENLGARVLAGAAAILLPVWVGFSRVYEAQHNAF